MGMVQAERAISLRRQCGLLSLARSCLYYCPRSNYEDSRFMNRISEIHAQHPFYGRRKIHWYLRRKEGEEINCKRVGRLMKEAGIRALVPMPRTTIPNSADTKFPYLLKGLKIDRANQVWSVDITYIKLPHGTVYLFALLDWHSRFVVGYKLCNTMEASHGLEVLAQAVKKYGRPEICNADQGSQFTGELWIAELQKLCIRPSHDGVGRCIDNVRIERFWRSIKYEDIFIHAYETLVATKKGIEKYVAFYNAERPHQALGYQRPAEVYLGKIVDQTNEVMAC